MSIVYVFENNFFYLLNLYIYNSIFCGPYELNYTE